MRWSDWAYVPVFLHETNLDFLLTWRKMFIVHVLFYIQTSMKQF